MMRINVVKMFISMVEMKSRIVILIILSILSEFSLYFVTEILPDRDLTLPPVSFYFITFFLLYEKALSMYSTVYAVIMVKCLIRLLFFAAYFIVFFT